MKNLFTLILIALFAAPAKSAWVPHDTLHELHEYYNAHYEGITHTHVEHSHSDQKFEKIHHPVQLDGPLKSTDITHLSITEAGQKKKPVKATGYLSVYLSSSELLLSILEEDPSLDTSVSSPFHFRNDIYLITQRFRV